MNRRERRATTKNGKGLRARANRLMRAGSGDVVALEGGPMDGWLVKPDAPALQRAWRDDGHYARAGFNEDSIARARWEATR